ncbi:type II secretion system protein J [uncultured Pseudokineococcus sp.]|uniref:PulJ/GspJ family protein n=1 Tax=uncultured Pseudokineococcus sp. TaxID=1642928 RepID=UPI0026381542|nr:prepilin-type N-terminal cleavage/methylation domain-containing protein [uncultured Pseudokineococcus sp.]
MRRSRAAASSGDRGVTLVELLVAMSCASLVLLCLASVFAADLRSTTDVRDRTTAAAEVRHAVDVMSRRLRVATPPSTGGPAFQVVEPSTVRFTASIEPPGSAEAVDPALTLVTYRYDADLDCLAETLSAEDGSGARTTCVMRGATSGSVVLTYFADTASGDVAPDAAAVRGVGVELTSSVVRGGRSSSSSAATRVACPNTVPRA